MENRWLSPVSNETELVNLVTGVHHQILLLIIFHKVGENACEKFKMERLEGVPPTVKCHG